jgi:hypothetical protein
VGLANNLLMNLPEPFKHSTFAAAAAAAPEAPPPAQSQGGEADAAFVATPAPTRAAQGAGSSRGAGVPAGMVVAPWSVVALATLLHRCVLLSEGIFDVSWVLMEKKGVRFAGHNQLCCIFIQCTFQSSCCHYRHKGCLLCALCTRAHPRPRRCLNTLLHALFNPTNAPALWGCSCVAAGAATSLVL